MTEFARNRPARSLDAMTRSGSPSFGSGTEIGLANVGAAGSWRSGGGGTTWPAQPANVVASSRAPSGKRAFRKFRGEITGILLGVVRFGRKLGDPFHLIDLGRLGDGEITLQLSNPAAEPSGVALAHRPVAAHRVNAREDHEDEAEDREGAINFHARRPLW